MFNVDWKDVTPYLDKIGEAIKTMAHGLIKVQSTYTVSLSVRR